MKSDKDYRPFFLFLAITAMIVFMGLFTPINAKISRKIENFKTNLFYRSHPPGEEVFVPATQVPMDATPSATIAMPTATAEPAATANIEQQATSTFTPEPTMTATLVPLPAMTLVEGVKYEDQHGVWNYCAPTNLSMALTFWGWKGDRMVAGKWLKPMDKDKNVMFYEMASFVDEMTDYRAILRPWGTPELIKRLLVAGFPVLIEKGAYMQEVNGNESWMGHYNIITGYDDNTQEWIVDDSYYRPNLRISYELIDQEWRSFSYEFMVVYPGDKENEIYQILGPLTNEEWSKRNAFEQAERQVADAKDDEERYYAYFNRGAAQVELSDFFGAAQSFDKAFEAYANLDKARRPYRMIWYRTEPYFAYYYTGRYQDMIQLADITLNSTKEPYLEESYYWRAMARIALGEFPAAKEDLDQCLVLHPGFAACETLRREKGLE